MPVSYPLVNGSRCSWADLEIKVNRKLAQAIQEISFSSKLEPGEVRGAGTRLMGRTRGQETHEASITLLAEEWHELLGQLGDAFGEKPFDISISYRLGDESSAAKIHTAQILGCRIKGVDDSHQQGTDATKVKLDLHPMDIIRDGKRISSGIKK